MSFALCLAFGAKIKSVIEPDRVEHLSLRFKKLHRPESYILIRVSEHYYYSPHNNWCYSVDMTAHISENGKDPVGNFFFIQSRSILIYFCLSCTITACSSLGSICFPVVLGSHLLEFLNSLKTFSLLLTFAATALAYCMGVYEYSLVSGR